MIYPKEPDNAGEMMALTVLADKRQAGQEVSGNKRAIQAPAVQKCVTTHQ